MEAVTFGSSLPGYELGTKELPAVIVIQEWWGIDDVIKTLAEKIHSRSGYRILVPDLYKGKIGTNKEEAQHLMSNLNFENGVEELKQAVKYLRDTGSPKIGAVGFCMGGSLSFCAAEQAGIDCAAAFYGTPPASICTPTQIKIPMQAHFGKLDTLIGFSDLKTAEIMERSMKDANVPCDFFYYDDAGHAFMNEGELGKIHREMVGFPEPGQEARDNAWKRLIHFLNENLKT